MGTGTAGCAMGTAGALRAERDCRVTMHEPTEAPELSEDAGGGPGVKELAVVEQPPLHVRDLSDEVRTISESDGRTMARGVAAEDGHIAGATTGLYLAAAAEVAGGCDTTHDVVPTVARDTGLTSLAGDRFAE